MPLDEDGPVSALEMAIAERNAVALGVSIELLMENAGRAVAEEAVRHLPPAPARVAVLVGGGNNGGDGSVAAHYLGEWGYSPELFLARPAEEVASAPARRCLDRARTQFPSHVGVPRPAELGEFALLIDALLGTGQAGPVRSPYREVAEAAQASGTPILSVDVPSGLGQSGGVRPKWTVALTARKEGTTPSSSGEVTVRDIGIPREARERTGPGEYLLYPAAPAPGSHPRPGRVLVIGGGPFAGAPALAALAALRAGAERATVLAPLPAADRVQSFSPNLIVHAIGTDHFDPADLPALEGALSDGTVDAVVLGMGIGRAPATLEAMRAFLPGLLGRVPTVVDADALDALPAEVPGEAGHSTVLATPNVTEWARAFQGAPTTDPGEHAEEVRRRAAARHLTVLAKGEVDVVSDGRRTLFNRNHPRWLAVSGAGDVLAGVAGALLARGVPAVAAGRLAAYWAGDAGHRAAARQGPGLLATDVVDELPAALLAGLARVARPGP